METEEDRGTVTDRLQLRHLADAAAIEVIDYLVEKFDGNDYACSRHGQTPGHLST